MFWGLVLKTNKRYSQCITKAFHISNATLDLSTIDSDNSVIQVWVHTDESDHLLCNLSKQASQVPLDLAFTVGEVVAFYSKGSGTVHLNGYILPEDDFNFGENSFGDEEAEDEEEDEDADIDMNDFKKSLKKAKGVKQAVGNAEDDSDSDDDDDDDDDLDDDDSLGEDDDDSDSDDDDDDELDDDDEDDSDDDETNEMDDGQPPKKKTKQNGLANGKVAQKEIKQNDQQQKKQKGQSEQQKKDKNQQTPQQKSVRKTLAHGVQIEDIRPGKGNEAKPGKRVTVYYEGRLQSNNKVFDSSKSGAGFKFQLGRSEVIRGWDIGVAGMRVGGKRKIICPPQAAYGPKGAPPQIPPNATLVFDVELRSA